MTGVEFKDALISAIINNSNLEGKSNDELLFKGIKTIAEDKNSDHKIFIETENRVFTVSFDCYTK